MKWKCLICAFFLLFVGCAEASANTEQNQNYIVYLKSAFKLQSTSENEGSDYIIVGKKELDDLLAENKVASYEPDYEVKLFDVPSDEETVDRWVLDAIRIAPARKLGCDGQGIKIAVIDSGFSRHPDLPGVITDWHNYIDGSGSDNPSDDSDCFDSLTDNIGHGTFVSGLIVAAANGVGIDGIASHAAIVPLKCFDTGITTTVSMIHDAIKAAVDTFHCDIINLSLGLAQYSETLEEAVNYAESKNVTVVAAVGNSGSSALYYPAAFDSVIGVGAVNNKGTRYKNSQINESVFITAPGEGVPSTTNMGGYSVKDGTSFATPIVAGVAAIMKNLDSSLTAQEIRDILAETAEDKGISGYDHYYGHGVVNAENIVNLMLKDTDFFLSPIILDEKGAYVTAFNHTEETFRGVCLWGNYTKNNMNGFASSFVQIPSQDAVRTYCDFESDTVKCFLWKNLTDLSPVAKGQEIIFSKEEKDEIN